MQEKYSHGSEGLSVRSTPWRQRPRQEQRSPSEHHGIRNKVDRIRHLGWITGQGQDRQVEEYRDQQHYHSDPDRGRAWPLVEQQRRSRHHQESSHRVSPERVKLYPARG